MNIAKFFVKTTENSQKYEISLYDTKYVSYEIMSLPTIFKKFFNDLWSYFFKMNKIPEQNFNEAVEQNIVNLFEEHNNFLEECGEQKIPYQEIFNDESKKEKREKMDYIQ